MRDWMLKRVYDPPARDDGIRVLVDRIWPRGLAKEEALVDEWVKEVAPSPDLRKWFGHDPKKWVAFQARYHRELNRNRDAVDRLLDLRRDGPVTLVFAARDTAHNNAVALKGYLEERDRGRGTGH